uniref:Uncharacterized protein n=3 Tax=Candidatus Kentrum eta TaxID=2126337 RepID=A0A450V999_9GAMM|nr:MAG: hypothetical protein BECKH772B_GA0070898_102285 [Candidatus Kentron sp. H]
MVRRPSFELAFEFLKRAMFRQQNTSMAIGKQFHSAALRPGPVQEPAGGIQCIIDKTLQYHSVNVFQASNRAKNNGLGTKTAWALFLLSQWLIILPKYPMATADATKAM